MSMISKVSINNVSYDVKDAKAREDLATLLGLHDLEALSEGAWYPVATEITTDTTDEELVSGLGVKNYVDSQIGAIKTFDIVVPGPVAAEVPAGATYYDGTYTVEGTLTASADTMLKLYLVKNFSAAAGTHIEYITIRNGSEGSYVYAWEQIGSTQTDLSNYVQKTTKIANVAIGDEITVAQLSDTNSLNLKGLAHKDAEEVYYEKTTLVNIQDYTNPNNPVNYQPAGTVEVTVATKDADAVIGTKEDYTPSGDVKFTNNTSGTETTGSYTPKGSVTVTFEEDQQVITTAGTLPELNPAKFYGGSAASIDTTKFPQPTLTTTNQNVVASALGSCTVDDNETLIFTYAEPVNVKVVNTFSPGEFEEGFFTTNNVAEIQAGFFSQGTLPTLESPTVTTAFSGETETVGFEGNTAEDLIPSEITYQTVDNDNNSATFTGTIAAALQAKNSNIGTTSTGLTLE